MRNILKFIIVGVFAILVSCELNETPKFSDSDAFVAFDNGSASVNENGTTLSIPVTLASISGMTQAVTYTVIDGTAKEGVNFTLEDATKTLTFDAENRTQNIVINVINNPGVFTGDLSFQIQLSEDGKVKPSAQNICTVVIADLDHPLSAFFGTWNASANSYYDGDVQWSVIIDKDPSDITVVWVQNVVHGFVKWGYTYPGNDTRFYAVVNEDNELKFPIGQVCAYQYQGNDISLVGLDAEGNTIDSGNVTATLSEDGNVITFVEGVYVSDATGGWDAIKPGMTWTKN